MGLPVGSETGSAFIGDNSLIVAVPAIMRNLTLRPLDPFRFVLIAVAGRMNQQQVQVIDHIREENRVPCEQLRGRRSRLTWVMHSA
jgi:hypothetical protein